MPFSFFIIFIFKPFGYTKPFLHVVMGSHLMRTAINTATMEFTPVDPLVPTKIAA